MPRALNETKIDTRSARTKLSPRPHQPYWRGIGPGLHLGYRKGSTGGKWCVRWSIGGGAARIETFATADDQGDADGKTILTFAQAVERARHVHQQVNQPVAPEPVPEEMKPITVQDACERYVAHLRSQGQKTWTDAERRLKRYVALDMKELKPRQRRKADPEQETRSLVFIGEHTISELRLSDLEEWRNALVHDDDDPDVVRKSMDTANRLINYLKAALNRLMLDPANGVTSDLAWRFLKPFKEVGMARQVHLTQAQVAQLLKVTTGSLHRMVVGLLLTGARPPSGELALVRARDFNAATGSVYVQDSKTGPRTVVLTDEGVKFFERITAGLASDTLVFPRPNGSAWCKTSFRRALAAAVGVVNAHTDTPPAARLPEDTCPYSLRHTHASQALMNGMNLQLLAENMGTSVKMLEQNYGKFIQATRRTLIEAAAPKLGLIDAE